MRVNRITLWSVDLTSHETYYMAEGENLRHGEDPRAVS